jgi:hypothetical protein
MTQITPSRELIQEEEVSYRSGVTEGTFFRFGSVVNLHSLKQINQHSWHLNGRYQLLPFVGPDGVFSFTEDAEIAGYLLTLGTTGSSGTNEVTVNQINPDTGAVISSIFSVNPSVTSAAADGSVSQLRTRDNTILSQPAGHTMGAFNTLLFSAGDTLRLDTVTSAGGARNLQLTIMYRPY